MICPKCGSQQRDGAAFCSVCGTGLGAPVYTAPVNAPAAGNELSAAPSNGFAARYVGIIVFGVLFLGILVIAMASGLLRAKALSNVFMQWLPLALAAMGMVVAGRAGGVDLSIAGLMALAPALMVTFIHGALGAGIIVALLVCLAIGFVNGVFAVFLRIPSVLVTLGTLLLTRTMAVWILGAHTVGPIANRFPYELLFLILPFAAAGAFLFIFFTKLGKPFPKRDQGKKPVWLYVFTYVFSAGLACIAGIVLSLRMNAATPTMGNGVEFYLLFILFVAGSSTLWDNRVAPVPAALIASLFMSIWMFSMSVLGARSEYQMVFLALYLLAALALDRVYRRNIFPFRPLDSKG